MALNEFDFHTLVPIVAGAAGGVVRSISLRQNWRESTATVIVGILCSTYFSTPVAPFLVGQMPNFFPTLEAALGPAGFCVGFLGIAATGVGLDIFRAWTKRFKGETK